MVQEEVSFEDSSYLGLWWPFCLVKRYHLSIIVNGHYEKYFCKIVFNWDQRFRRKCHFKIFLIWSSGGHFVQFKQKA